MIYICENILDFDIEEALRTVSVERRESALRYRFDIDRRQSLAAYLLLQHGLREEYALDIMPRLEYDDRGKPRMLDYPDIHFNISHCRRGVACAISRVPIGVDIEVIDAIDWDVARRVMNAAQLDAIAASPTPERAFCKLWTIKESILKYSGEGLCDDLPRLAIDNYTFAHYHGDSYICTACCSRSVEHEEFMLVGL